MPESTGKPRGLITDPAERKARRVEKQTTILQWLADEGWSTEAILARAAGLAAPSAIRRTFTELEGRKLIRRASLGIVGPEFRVWGITKDGIGGLPPVIDGPQPSPFDPSKLAPGQAKHHLIRQELRLSAEATGWTNWRRQRRAIPKAGRGQPPYVPDVIATRPDGLVVAIEVELTTKTPARYRKIGNIHVEAVTLNQIAGVYYVGPEAVIEAVRRLLPAGAAERCIFVTVDKWPPQVKPSDFKPIAHKSASRPHAPQQPPTVQTVPAASIDADGRVEWIKPDDFDDLLPGSVIQAAAERFAKRASRNDLVWLADPNAGGFDDWSEVALRVGIGPGLLSALYDTTSNCPISEEFETAVYRLAGVDEGQLREEIEAARQRLVDAKKPPAPPAKRGLFSRK